MRIYAEFELVDNQDGCFGCVFDSATDSCSLSDKATQQYCNEDKIWKIVEVGTVVDKFNTREVKHEG